MIVSVDGDTDFEDAAAAISAGAARGWTIVGVLAAQDDAVLIRNRIPLDIPVVDEVMLAGLAPGALVAVEVVAEDAPTGRWPIPSRCVPHWNSAMSRFTMSPNSPGSLRIRLPSR